MCDNRAMLFEIGNQCNTIYRNDTYYISILLDPSPVTALTFITHQIWNRYILMMTKKKFYKFIPLSYFDGSDRVDKGSNLLIRKIILICYIQA